jgi:hypothetical protein
LIGFSIHILSPKQDDAAEVDVMGHTCLLQLGYLAQERISIQIGILPMRGAAQGRDTLQEVTRVK